MLKAEYLFRPQQIWQRLRDSGRSRDRVVLPWGDELRCSAIDDIGKTLLALGAFELPATEAVFRLVADGDIAIDVGANIGYMASAMSFRVGSQGRVLAMEPHPQLACEIRDHVGLWGRSNVSIIEQAASSHKGRASLTVPDHFDRNRGTASLGTGSTGKSTHEVQTTTLDELGTPFTRIAMIKIDVEGHEEAVLKGASRILGDGRVMHWVFEEHRPYPSPVTKILEQHGYHIYRLERSLWGPVLQDPASPAKTLWEAPNFLASREHGVAEKFKPRGWHCLRPALT